MNKKWLALCGCLVGMILSPNVIHAETLEEELNHVEGLSQKYETELSPAYIRTNTDEENISPQSGTLSIAQTDYVLPGRNGLDLEIKRIYKSGSSNIREMKVKYVAGAWVDYVEADATTGSFYENAYNLGIGMRFSFPMIEVVDNEDGSKNLFLHNESGDVYRFRNPTTVDGEELYMPIGQRVLDVVMKKSTAFSNGQTDGTSAYVLSNKDGRLEYFSEDGRILAIEDKYGNRITFVYETLSYTIGSETIEKRLISKITDSVGRVVTLTYKENHNYTVKPQGSESVSHAYDVDQNPNTTDSGDLAGSYQVIVTLPNSQKIVYDKSAALVDDNKKVLRTRLQRVYDVDNQVKYHLWYEQPSLGFSYSNPSTYTAYNRYENLVQIDYCKENRLKRYTYDTFEKTLNTGSMQYRKIFSDMELEKEGFSYNAADFLGSYTTTTLTKRDYTYHNEPDGFNSEGYSEDYEKLKSYRYTTSYKDLSGVRLTYSYDGLHELVDLTEEGNDHKKSVISTYDSMHLLSMKKVVLEMRKDGEIVGKPVEEIENFNYDEYGNLTNYTGIEAERDENGEPINSEHKIIYTYDYERYHGVTSKTYKMDAETTVQTTYALNDKGDVLSESTQYEDRGQKKIQKTDYTYDTYGNMLSKDQHVGDDHYVSYYEYGTDYKGVNHKGAFLTKSYMLVEGQPVAYQYSYDHVTGLVIGEKDALGYETTYTYDVSKRMVKQTNPDGSSRLMAYTNDPYSQRQITETDAEGYKTRRTFNALGQASKSEKMVGNEWVVLGLCFYDDRGNLLKDIDAMGNTITYAYNSLGYLTQKNYMGSGTQVLSRETYDYSGGIEDGEKYILTYTDELGNKTVSHYNMQELLTRRERHIENEAIATQTFEYNYLGNKVLETDANGHQTTYAYNALGRLVKVTNALGYYVLYSYNPLGDVEQTLENNQRLTVQLFDAKGRVREVRTMENGSDAYRFTANSYNNNDQIVATERGDYDGDNRHSLSKSVYTYDAMNRMVSQQDRIAEGVMTQQTFTYDNRGQLVDQRQYIDDETYVQKTYTYDESGQLLQEAGKYQGQYTKTYTYDYNGNVTTQYVNGQTKEYRYDYRNLVVEMKEQMQESAWRTTTYQRDKKGQVLAETVSADGVSRKTSYAYNAMGQVRQQIDALGQRTRYAYDKVGNLIRTVDPRYSNLSMDEAPGMIYGYDALNQRTYTYAYDGKTQHVVRYTLYDAYGQVRLEADNQGYNEQQPTASIGNTYVYNIYGECVRMTDPQTTYENKINGTERATMRYVYDGVGNKRQDIQDGHVLWAYTYDGIGRMVTKTDGLGRTTRYAYDLTGEHYVKVTDPLGHAQESWQNVFGQAYRKVYPDGGVETATYNDKGYRMSKTDVLGHSTYYTYNLAGQMTEQRLWVETKDGQERYQSTEYGYNTMGDRITTQVYDLRESSTGDIISKNAVGKGVTYRYNGIGKVIEEVHTSGIKITVTYDKAGNMTERVTSRDGEEPTIQTFSYDYMGNIVEKARLVKISDIDNGYLAGAEYNSNYMDRISSKETYMYDVDKNLRQSTDANGQTTTFEYDYNGRVVKQTDALNRVTTTTYDINSRVIRRESPQGLVVETEYDLAGQKHRVITESATDYKAINAFVYDKAGRLIKEIEPKDYLIGTTDANRLGVTYTYDVMGRQIGKYDKSGEAIELRTYNMAGQLLRLDNGTVATYRYNGLNNVVEEENALGDVTGLTYDVLGNLLVSVDPLGRSTSYSYNQEGGVESITYPDGSSVHMAYSLDGQVIRQTNQGNFTTTVEYNGFGKQRWTRDALGHTTRYLYDRKGNCTQIIAADKSVTVLSYDEVGQLVEKKVPTMRDAAGNDHYRVETYIYNLDGQMTSQSMKDLDSGEERVQTITYYINGLVDTQTDGEGGKVSYTYDVNGNITDVYTLREASVSDRRHMTYDVENRLIAESFMLDETSTKPLAGSYAKTTRYIYDTYGKMLSKTEPSGVVTTYEYDALQRVNTMIGTYDEGTVTINYTYDAVGNVLREEQLPGMATNYTYDTMNRVLTQRQEGTTSYTYDELGNVTTMSDALGHETSYTYDALGQVLTVTDGTGTQVLSTTYDIMGNPTHSTDALGNETVTEYDLEGRVTAVTTPLGHTSRTVYNAFGDVVEAVNPDGSSTQYTYDRAGRMLSVIDAMGQTIHYGYDKASNLTYSVDAKGNINRYSYGAFGRRLTWTDALGQETSYLYDIVGNTIQITDRNGTTLRYSYNDRGMLTARETESTEDSRASLRITYTYDALGNQLTMEDATGTTRYTYDGYSRRIGVRYPEGEQLSYSYDTKGNRTRMTGVDGQVTRYTYDDRGLLTAVDYDGATTTYTYDAAGNRTATTLPNGVQTTYVYNEERRVVHMEQVTQQGNRISTYDYTYDVNGREATKKDAYGTTDYTYDRMGRLKEVNAPGYVTVYAYDANGNRTQQQTSYMNLQHSGYYDQPEAKEEGAAESNQGETPEAIQGQDGQEILYRKAIIYSTYDSSNRLVKTIKKMYDDTNGELLQETTGYLYDANGNEISQFGTYVKPHMLGDNQQMESGVNGEGQTTSELISRRMSRYDGFNRLIGIEETRGGKQQRMTYVYNGADQRVKKIVRSSDKAEMVTTRFIYDGSYLIQETDTTGRQISYVRGLTYLFKDETIGEASETRSYYLQDEHGNVTYMVNEAGAVVNAYDYDVFGQAILSLETETTNAIRYTSEYQDAESGLYYLRARYYNPMTGRFISEDSYRAGQENPFALNLYSYCHNDPVNFVDPSGHRELSDNNLTLSAQKEIDRLTDEYHGTSNKKRQKEIQNQANRIRERDRMLHPEGGKEVTEFGKKFNEAVKNSSYNDGKKNYVKSDTWKKLSKESKRRTGGKAQYDETEAAKDVAKYIKKEVEIAGDYESDIEKYTGIIEGTHEDVVRTINEKIASYVSMPRLERGESSPWTTQLLKYAANMTTGGGQATESNDLEIDQKEDVLSSLDFSMYLSGATEDNKRVVIQELNANPKMLQEILMRKQVQMIDVLTYDEIMDVMYEIQSEGTSEVEVPDYLYEYNPEYMGTNLDADLYAGYKFVYINGKIYVDDRNVDVEKLGEATKTYVSPRQWASIIVGFTPVDAAKDFTDLVAGKDVFTGEEANRYLLAATIIAPEIVDQALKQGAKHSDEILGFVRTTKGMDEVGEVRYKVGNAVDPIEKTYDMALNPELYIDAVVDKYGINLRGSGQDITVVFNPDLVSAGKSRQLTPNVIEIGPSALVSEEELANTIAHELNHARDWLKGGDALEDPAYKAGDALSDYINGGR